MKAAEPRSRLPNMGPGITSIYPRSAWTKLPPIDLQQVWQIVGGNVDQHMGAHPLWKVFCLVYLEGLAHGSQASEQKASAHQLPPETSAKSAESPQDPV